MRPEGWSMDWIRLWKGRFTWARNDSITDGRKDGPWGMGTGLLPFPP